ncbi:MAG: zinc-ribbon domain-containing protein [Myxococcales bacterium]|nr:zinc-ribbon domain-containing protein [Myxococcales bacterium]MCB9643420.1 zinc-ribbon domain-containing protein [Myxococcales bacterium]
MILTCTKCQARFQIPEDRIPPQGSAVRCASCQETYWLFRNGLLQSYSLGDPPPTFSVAQANAISSNRSPSGTHDAAPLPPAVIRLSQSQHELPIASLGDAPPISSLAPQAPMGLGDGEGLPNSEESWFDVPASLLQKKLKEQEDPPLQPSRGPKDSWLELPLEEILSKSSGLSSDSLPAPAPNTLLTSPNKPQQDSWFEIPTTSAALSTISPNDKKGIRDSWLDEEIGLPAHLREERIPDNLPLPSGFVQSPPTPSDLSFGSLSSTGLPSVPPPPPNPKTQSSASLNILGLDLEDDELPLPKPSSAKATTSKASSLTLNLDIESQELEKGEEIFGEALQASLDTPLTPPPSMVHGPSATAGIEFFLPDRVQQRQQFWFTFLPLLTRSVVVLSLLVLFLWLWGSLLAGNFSQQQLAFARLHTLLGADQNTWRLGKIKVHLYQHQKTPLFLISGELQNNTDKSQIEPDMQLIQANHPGAPISRRFRCCLRFQPEVLQSIRTRSRALGLYQIKNNERGKRRKIKAHGKNVFHIVWMPRSAASDFRIRVLPFSHKRAAKR